MCSNLHTTPESFAGSVDIKLMVWDVPVFLESSLQGAFQHGLFMGMVKKSSNSTRKLYRIKDSVRKVLATIRM